MNSASSPSARAFARATSTAPGELSIPVTVTPAALLRDRERDRARACADVEHPLPVLGQLDEQLRLRPRNQHAMIDDQLELAKVRPPEDVARPALAARGDARARRSAPRRRGRSSAAGRRAGPPGPCRAPRRASPRRRAAACPRPRSRALRPRARAPRATVKSPRPSAACGPQAAWASSFCRRSSAASASVNSSSSPSSTWSRLWAVSLIAVVGHPALREVVGAHLLGALPGADLRPAVRRQPSCCSRSACS